MRAKCAMLGSGIGCPMDGLRLSPAPHRHLFDRDLLAPLGPRLGGLGTGEHVAALVLPLHDARRGGPDVAAAEVGLGEDGDGERAARRRGTRRCAGCSAGWSPPRPRRSAPRSSPAGCSGGRRPASPTAACGSPRAPPRRTRPGPGPRPRRRKIYPPSPAAPRSCAGCPTGCSAVSATCHAYLDQGDRRLDLRVDRSLLRVVDRLHTALQHVEEIAEAQIQSSQTHDALCILRMRVLRTTGCHLLFISILFTTGETNPQIKYLLDFASLLIAPFPTRVSKRLTALSTALAKETNLWMYVRRDYASVAPFSTLTRGRWDKETRIVSTSIPMTITTVLS